MLAVVLSGVRTGRCIVSDDHPPNKSCEIYGWCPVEQDALPLYVIYLVYKCSTLQCDVACYSALIFIIYFLLRDIMRAHGFN